MISYYMYEYPEDHEGAIYDIASGTVSDDSDEPFDDDEAISYRQVVPELARILGKGMDVFEEDREDEDG